MLARRGLRARRRPAQSVAEPGVPAARPRPQAWKPSILASMASAHMPKDTSQRARRDQSGTSRRRESKQPVDVGTKRAAAGRLRTDRGAAAVESTPSPYRFYAGDDSFNTQQKKSFFFGEAKCPFFSLLAGQR